MQRIILYGPPLAGKATLLEAFASSRKLKMYQFDPLEGATRDQIAAGLPPDGSGEAVIERGLRVYDESTDVGFATIWGAFWNTNAWPILLARADAVLVTLDPQLTREEADRKCVLTLNTLGPSIRGCVVWTKQDLVGNKTKTVPSSVLSGTVAESWPVFRTRHDRSETMVEPIDRLVFELTKDQRC